MGFKIGDRVLYIGKWATLRREMLYGIITDEYASSGELTCRVIWYFTESNNYATTTKVKIDDVKLDRRFTRNKFLEEILN